MTLTVGGPIPLTAADISAAIDRADAIAAARSCGWVCWCGQSRAATHVHLSPAVSTRADCQTCGGDFALFIPFCPSCGRGGGE